MSKKILLCDKWEFAKTPLGSEYSDDLPWKPVDLPHDWLIYDVHNLYMTSTGWYRRRLVYTPDGKRASIRFDGVYMDSKIYVNGVLAGEWKYGYTTFEFDITGFLRKGENLIAVRVDYREPNSRWYSGAGIFRKVWLKTSGECRFTNDGVYISAKPDGDLNGVWTVYITSQTERPETLTAEGLSVRNAIYDGERKIADVINRCPACDKSRITGYIAKDGFKYSENTDTIKVESPELWDIENPKLYTLVSELIKDGETVDTEINTFGFRSIEFTTDKGFFLNGRHVKLHGCCEHHDLGCLGAAVNKNAIRRKLKTLRTMGVNAVRTSHNPPAPEFMELADEMGFLILSEGFDMWELKKTEYDYARFFPEWIEKDVASWVRRDRNHPSIIGWSIGNEIYDTHFSERGQEVTSLLKGLVSEHDPRGNGYITIGSNYMQSDNAQRCADILKVAGYNYAERLYEEHHKDHPDWMIYGSETSSVVQSRGIYHFPLSQQVLCEDDEQCSALGNTSPGWAAKSTEACIIPDRDTEFCAGQFIWTGFDYIGEPTPYSTKNSYFGQFDTAGFAKDSAYIFRSAWVDYKEAPFVHIYPYWDFSEGQPIDVRVASNAPTVELYFNGELIAQKSFDRKTCTELTLDTKLKYKKGELTAVAYDENKNEIARDSVRSFGDAAYMKLTPDKTVMRADGEDLIFIDISAYDKDGNFCANANDRVFVNVSGAARLIGLDNGDSTDYDQYKGVSRRLFSGKLLAVIAAKLSGGEIKVSVTSPSLAEAQLELLSEDCGSVSGVSADTENKPSDCECANPESDIPVRKIELTADGFEFDPKTRERKIRIDAYPENSNYASDISFRLTTVTGIDVNNAELSEFKDGKVTVTCKGDGEFYLRALCKNGTDKNHILTALPFSASGLGLASTDPYSFVAGGLFTVSNGEIANGIDRGAGFTFKYGYFGFENVDFGKLGSDSVNIPIYMNCSTPIRLKIYDGIPNCGGELIGDFEYLKPSVWLTYNEPENFTLTKKLKGVHTLCFESENGFEIKGFRFDKPQKEFSELCAADCESVYGDKFTREQDAVTGIGNNVVVDFGEFDFTEKSPSKIIVCGKSQLPVNSIHLTFKGETEKRIQLEFTGCGEYTERAFDLPEIVGKYGVSFTFLPGSDFDFKTIRFEE